jgi:hypothetical protein
MFLSTLIWSFPHSRWGTRELQHGQFLPVTRHPQIAREGDWNCKMCHLVTVGLCGTCGAKSQILAVSRSFYFHLCSIPTWDDLILDIEPF